MEAKIGIEYEHGSTLLKIDKRQDVEEIVKEICKKIELTNKGYGLKFSHTLNSEYLNLYVTEDNKNIIKDGCKLQLVESLDSIISNTLKKSKADLTKLIDLSIDPGFIKAIVKHDCENIILKWIEKNFLTGDELCGCLITLLNLIKNGHVTNLTRKVLEPIISCIKNLTMAKESQFALAVVCQVLYARNNENLNQSKLYIQKEISIDDLMPYIKTEDNPQLQLNAVMLINAMVKSKKPDKRQELIVKMKENRNSIFTNIISSRNVTDAMAHELYVYQTYILSLYSNFLNEKINLDMDLYKHFLFFDVISPEDNSFNFNEKIFDPCELNSGNDETIKTLRTERSDIINGLTLRCIEYYRKNYYESFRQLREESKSFEHDFLPILERITKLISVVLHIGKNPKKVGILYQPILFDGSIENDFVYRLFSNTMILFLKTRHDMKLYTNKDIDKVEYETIRESLYPFSKLQLFLIIQKQLEMILLEKPINYGLLMKKILTTSYKNVLNQWQKEEENEWKNIYEKNPCVQELKKSRFETPNRLIVEEKRIKTVQLGEHFKKFQKKSKCKHTFIKLSENKSYFQYGDYHNDFTSLILNQSFGVTDIAHFLKGETCPHVKNQVFVLKTKICIAFLHQPFCSVKNAKLAISIILQNGEALNFLARNEKIANIWIDAFNILLGKEDRSSDYTEELETLMEMDCAIHLVEIQNISLPKEAPPVPPLPSFLQDKQYVPESLQK